MQEWTLSLSTVNEGMLVLHIRWSALHMVTSSPLEYCPERTGIMNTFPDEETNAPLLVQFRTMNGSPFSILKDLV